MFIYNTLHVYFRTTSRKKLSQSGIHTDLYGPLYINPEKVVCADHTRIQPGVCIYDFEGKVIIKKFSAIGAGCTIIPGTHIPTVGMPQYLSDAHINDKSSDIIIEEDCWVGTHSILLSNCKLGRGCVVGAGALVTKNVPPYAVVGGTPAKIIASRFSTEQILRHEQILYPAEERMSREELEEIFNTYFNGKRSIGADELTGEKREALSAAMKSKDITDYSK